jgi:phospholipid/cholesterol/gamma-HCH transport system ATP-binding protein
MTTPGTEPPGKKEPIPETDPTLVALPGEVAPAPADEHAPHVPHAEPVSFKGMVPPVMIEFRGVTKAFGTRTVLDDVTLQVYKGETLCIMGQSGQGKSVTLKHIVGLLQPDRGSVHVAGLDVTRGRNGEMEEARKKIGFLFQNAALLASFDVFENVALPLREHETLSEARIAERVLRVLELVGLKEHARKMPALLSGGMRKRAGLARAIVRDPQIILYDEPTAGLDPVISSTINDLILDMQKKLGVTSILVTHDMASAFKVSNRLAFLYRGKILKIGPPDDFRHTDDPMLRQFILGESEGPLTREVK